MSVSAAVKSRLLGRARDEAERAPLPERGKALVALARGGDAEDISRAVVASQGKDVLRAQLAVHLVKAGRFDEALSFLPTIQKMSLRGFAAQELALALPKEKPLEIPVEGLPPKYLSNILFQAAIKGASIDPQLILRSRERVSDELERTQVVSQGSALLVLVGRLDEAKRMVEALPAWASDEYHCLVVEAYARSGRADDARHYVRGINEDCLRMECFLRHLEHTEDRVTAVLARSLLNLSKVPKGYSLKLALRTRAVPDLERAEQYVWQDLDEPTLFSALSFIELGELLSRSKEADRARELFKKSADPKDPLAGLCASRLAALIINTQGAQSAEGFLQELTGNLRKSALQNIVPGLVRLNDINHAFTMAAQLPDVESRVLALVEAIVEKAPEKLSADNGFQDRTPTPPVVAPSESDERTNLVPVAKKIEEPRPIVEPRAPSSNQALDALLGSNPENFEDDSTVNSRRRRSATELREIIDQVAPQTSDGWSRRDVEDPSVAAWEPALKPEEPTSRKELPKQAREDVWREPSPPKSSAWKEPTPDSKPSLVTRGAPVLSSARVSVAQINARKEPVSRPEYYVRPEPAIEEAKRLIARGDPNLQADALRCVWVLTRDGAALAEAKNACRGQAAAMRSLGVSLARCGATQEAKTLALEIPDGEERGKVLAEIAKGLCKQMNVAGAEAEVLYSAHPAARAMILIEVAKHSRSPEHVEDASAVTSEVSDTTLRATLWREVAALYAIASRPARALRFGGEASRVEIAKRLARLNRREEAQRYIEIIDDPERKLLGQIYLIQPNLEDAFYKRALAGLEALSSPKRQLRSALLLARASRLSADIARAKGLAEKHAERDTLEGAKDLLLWLEVAPDDAIFDALVSWFSRQRVARPDEAELVRVWAPLCLQRDKSGKALVAAVESMPEMGLRSIASEAAARTLAPANLQEQASRAMRAAIEPTFSAYGLFAIAAHLKNEPSPVEHPEPSELFSV